MSDPTETQISRRSIAFAVVSAAVLGLLLALLGGNDQLFSVQIWFACFSAWLAVLIGSQVIKRLPVQPPPLLALWSRKDDTANDEERIPRPLRAAEHLVLRARDNERAYAAQLRPRLTTLAAHNLRVAHGIDMAANPERANQLLGDTAWLVDPQVTTRQPTMQELDDFLTRIQGDTR